MIKCSFSCSMCFTFFPLLSSMYVLTRLSDFNKRHMLVLFCDSWVNSEAENIISHLAESQSPFKYPTGCPLTVIFEYTIPPIWFVCHLGATYNMYIYFWLFILEHSSVILYEITVSTLKHRSYVVHQDCKHPETQSIVPVITTCSIAGLASTKQCSL